MRLLRVYPAAWRARYGDELAVLIEELGEGARVSWRDRLDVLRAGAVERVRAFGGRGLPPRERAREGSLLVLYAWMLFVLGGFGVQKASEHWKAATPTGKQGLPAAAFDVLITVAVVGSMLVVVGIVVMLPWVAAFLRRGGWAEIRRPIIRAALLSMLVAATTIGIGVWARSLTPAARNGHDAVYTGVFAAWVVLLAACLFAWAGAAAATARRLSLPDQLLRVEVWVGVAVTVAMTVMTISAAIWWGSLARVAPWFFTGRPAGVAASALVWNMVLPVVLMLCASVAGVAGAIRALRALPATTVHRSAR